MLASFALVAQNPDDCKQMIKRVYQQLENQYSTRGEGVFYLEYTSKILLPEEKDWVITNVKVYSNQAKSYLVSNEVAVYEDQHTSLSIIPSNKIIYLRDFVQDPMKENRLKELAFFQDSMLIHSEVSFCQTLNNGNKKIQLNLTKSGKKLFHAESASFTLDLKSNTLKQVEINYLSDYKIREMILVFNEVDDNYHTTLLSAPLMSQIYEPNGNLKEQYRGYRIYDSRKINR